MFNKVLKTPQKFLVKELRVLYMDQKHTIAFSSGTNLVFVVALKIACFSIRFSIYIQDNIP